MALGFTAINEASDSTTKSDRPKRSTRAVNNDRAPTIVSQYLGRGESAPDKPVPTGTRKAGAKGRKRAAPKSDTANAKRKRTSSVKDGMSVTKNANASATSAHDDEPAPKKQKGNGSKSVSKADTVGASGSGVEVTALKPVRVYGSTTSMDALDSTSARTSFDSAKANAGHSFTLYQGSSSGSFTPANAEYSRPLLSSSRIDSQNHEHTDTPPPKNAAKTKGGKTKTAGKQTQTDSVAKVSANSSQVIRKAKSTNAPPATAFDFDDSDFLSLDDEDLLNIDAAPPRRSKRLRKNTPQAPAGEPPGHTGQADDENDFSDVEDDDLVDMALSVERFIGIRPATPPPRKKSQNMREVDEYEDYGGDLLSAEEKKVLADAQKKREDAKFKPIVRKPLQPTVLDRSSIWGASNSTTLRTCFRLGEALNTGSRAVRCNHNVVIELYARVTSSWREEKPRRKQHFVFKDLYHDKAPHLEGTYELWDQAVLWDLDSKAFLKATDEGIMCRAIAKMKREQQKWRLEILSIWEATWEDVNYVAGICMGDINEDDDDDDED